MTTYLLLKLLHILSSVVLVGTGFGSAFYLYFVNRRRDVAAIAPVLRLVVRADWWFTTPTVILQPASGLAMVWLGGWPLSQPWLLWSYALYALAGCCWLPVLWLQIRMAALADLALAQQRQLPLLYWRYARYWEWLGYPAFVAMMLIYALMVIKPAL